MAPHNPVSDFLSTSELAAVGRLALVSSWFEFEIERVLVKLLTIEEADREALLARVPIRTKMQVLSALILRRAGGNPGAETAWKELRDRFEEVSTTRRHALHGVWEAVGIREYVATLPRRDKGPTEERIDERWLQETASRLEDLRDDITEFVSSL